ncbi:MAG: hypothetical protein M0C28_37830, partial [Candidatus Moduliflexus flocculans]|nr:hypothetical protein [Candidatus Moduliflexus flocculans]
MLPDQGQVSQPDLRRRAAAGGHRPGPGPASRRSSSPTSRPETSTARPARPCSSVMTRMIRELGDDPGHGHPRPGDRPQGRPHPRARRRPHLQVLPRRREGRWRRPGSCSRTATASSDGSGRPVPTFVSEDGEERHRTPKRIGRSRSWATLREIELLVGELYRAVRLGLRRGPRALGRAEPGGGGARGPGRRPRGHAGFRRAGRRPRWTRSTWRRSETYKKGHRVSAGPARAGARSSAAAPCSSP